MCFGENVTSIYSFQNYWTFAKRVLDKDERHLLVLKTLALLSRDCIAHARVDGLVLGNLAFLALN